MSEHTPARLIDRDDETVGRNVRTWFDRKKGDRQWIGLAAELGIRKETLSRKVAGKERFTEAQLVTIGKWLGIHAGHFLVGVNERSRWPGIPSVTVRGKARDRKGRAIRSIDTIIKDPSLMSEFVGGIAEAHIPTFTQYFTAIRTKAYELRQAASRNPVQP